MAFHLGCLRALNTLGLLDQVKAVSTVSGGSVIGTAWAMHDGDFKSFEHKIRTVLQSGFVKAAIRNLFSALGLKVVGSFLIAAILSTLLLLLRLVGRVMAFFIPALKPLSRWLSALRSPWRRAYTRSSLLAAAMTDLIFGETSLQDLSAKPFRLIINATELRTGSAFRYSPVHSGSWRWGELVSNDMPLAHAVAVSAAYPLFLPAFDEVHRFQKKGKTSEHRVLLTDGGVYDNLGLGVFWPGRSPEVSLNVVKVESIICCTAGYGLKLDEPHSFLPARLMSAVGTIFERTQNHSMARLHEMKDAGVIKSFILPHLGQQDSSLPDRPVDLVPREEVHAYPTDFNGMSGHWIDRLSLRGEQLTKLLARHYFKETATTEQQPQASLETK
jgi:NTE family protein